jgi:hypothetical protein
VEFGRCVNDLPDKIDIPRDKNGINLAYSNGLMCVINQNCMIDKNKLHD